MSTQTKKAIVRRLMEQVWKNLRIDLIEEFFTEEVVEHFARISPQPGMEGVREAANIILNAFPDFQLTIEDEIAEGDKVVNRWTMWGTHQGELPGIPATGKQVTQSGVTIFHLSNARVAEFWILTDKLSMMHQLGVIPMPDEA